MKRTHLFSLMVLIAAVPAATASSFFTSNAKPCFVSGNTGYELSGSASADYTVRVDNAAPAPSLRMQVVDDPAAADFVLIDDEDSAGTCKASSDIRSVHVNPAALDADLTITVSPQPADFKIYVRSVNFTAQDAAALFAVIWQTARHGGQHAGLGREFAERH
jgi:hypothetical protein